MKILLSVVIIFVCVCSLFGVHLSDTGIKIADKLVDHGINPYLVVLLIATLPIVELRGSIPIGILYFGLNWKLVVIFSIIGNIIPIFFILFLFGVVERFLRRFKIFDKFFNWLFKRTLARSGTIEKYEELGLMLFVAIPAPVTGAWTGSLASYLFKLSYLKSILFIILGVLIAACIVTTLTFFWKIGLIILIIGIIAFLYISIAGVVKSVKENKKK